MAQLALSHRPLHIFSRCTFIHVMQPIHEQPLFRTHKLTVIPGPCTLSATNLLQAYTLSAFLSLLTVTAAASLFYRCIGRASSHAPQCVWLPVRLLVVAYPNLGLTRSASCVPKWRDVHSIGSGGEGSHPIKIHRGISGVKDFVGRFRKHAHLHFVFQVCEKFLSNTSILSPPFPPLFGLLYSQRCSVLCSILFL